MDGAELFVYLLPKSLDLVVDGSQLTLLSYLYAGQLPVLPFALLTQGFPNSVPEFFSLIQLTPLSEHPVLMRNVRERIGIFCVSFWNIKSFSTVVGCLYLSV